MEKLERKLLLLFAFLHASFPLLNGFQFYKAAVFEIRQFDDPSVSKEEIIKQNLLKYYLAAEKAKAHKVDIIVYPEEGLYTSFDGTNSWSLDYSENVPDPRREIANPCRQPYKFRNSPILRNLSCIAKEHNLYVVANYHDIKNCEVRFWCNKYNIDHCRTSRKDCPPGGKFIFNTQVVFNREGLLIARYHKKHLFLEYGKTAARDNDTVYFETEFGKFAMAVCFDLFFADVVKGVERPGVTGLSFDTWWFDHTPLFAFSTPYQQSWSMTNNVNFLAANVHEPRQGTLGSGIYSPVKGALVSTHNPDGLSKLLISKVPVSPQSVPKDMSSFDTKFYHMLDNGSFIELHGEEPRNLRNECGENVLGNATGDITDYRCHQSEVQQYTFVKLNETEGDFRVCSNGFCCSLKYCADSMDETFYFGVSGNPLIFYGFRFGVQACFLTRCDPVEGKVCRNYILKSNTIFNTVEIEGSFDTKYIHPFAIDSEVRLTDRDEWHFDKKSRMEYENLRGRPLLFLGLYGNLHELDKNLSD